jgi:HD-GYP domain-containing protein (c-di-GMP phosphodiesterase class II)
MLRNLRRRDLDIYAVWCKFPFHEAVAAELEVLKLPAAQLRVASDTERIPFVPTIPRRSHSPRRFSANPLREISDASLAISSERDIDRLLEMILTKVQALTRSDGGILYLLNKEEKTLEFKAVQYLSLGIRMGGADGEPILWEPLPLYTPEGQPGTHMAAAAFFENRVINIPDIYHAEDYDFLETKNFDEQTGYRSQSMLILPLRNHENILVGILQLINKKTEEGEVVSYGATDEDIAIILAMQAATVLTKQQFIDDMETLFESFLHSIIIAIENKSRYTAGHIQKMVAVTSMLVDAVNSDETLFPDTYFDTEEKKQIILAAMMHDVGKIVIPEYIIDKATRLQTLFDRIELVRLRAEIRRKEALIDVLAGRGKSKRSIAKKDPYYCDRLAEIDRDLSLIEHLNTATEPIREEEIARLKKAARAPIVLNDTPTPWLSDDEVENLCIRQGTLTSMERKIINNHAYVGMKMLQKVKFPKKYARIPKIASAHHEKLDGSGYPLGLAGKEICLEARILAVADIFEALTAADRPYKKPETAEGAMVILEQMARKGELDPKIVSLLRSGGLYGKIDREILSHDSLDT